MAEILLDILRSVRLRGAVFLDARLSAPWAISSMVTAEACKPLFSRPSQLIAYHMVVEGEMLLWANGEQPTLLKAGEIVLLPHNDVHTAASEPGLTPVDGQNLIEPSPSGGLARVDYGGGGANVRLYCGFLGCEDAYNPLIAALPRVLVVSMRDAASKDFVEASLKFAIEELAHGRLADSSVMSRLSELLLIEAVRQYVESLGDKQMGWLQALKNPGIGRALGVIHRDIAATLTSEGLAREAGMSRSAFMDRFSSLVGMPPMRYLTLWRLETAKAQLHETTRSVAQVAHAVGYESEEAFSRAFKREFGISPSVWRDQQIPKKGP